MTDILEHTDLEALLNESIPCTWVPCPNEPHWKTVCRYCHSDAGGRLCDEHKQVMRRELPGIDAAMLIRGLRYYCEHCGKSGLASEMGVVVPL